MQRPFFEDDLDWRASEGSEHLLVSLWHSVSIFRLDRPEALNALSAELFTTLVEEVTKAAEDDGVDAIVITGGRRVFAAGADIRELAGKSPQEVHDLSRLDEWRQLARIRKPLIAAVNGMALGGGCELAMVCDIIIAGEDAVFALPETGLGLMPGGGGTQRLIRAVGKSVAMDMILTGRRLKARDALGFGLIARVAPNELVLDLAVSVGEHIAARPRDAVARAKYAVLLAENLALATGIEHERRLFESLFESNETQEKMRSFLDDRASKPPGRIP